MAPWSARARCTSARTGRTSGPDRPAGAAADASGAYPGLPPRGAYRPPGFRRAPDVQRPAFRRAELRGTAPRRPELRRPAHELRPTPLRGTGTAGVGRALGPAQLFSAGSGVVSP